MAALPVWSNPVFVRTAQPEAIPNMFPANVPLLSRKVAKSPNSSGLFGVMLARSETHSRTPRDSEHIPITSSNPNESAPRKATLYTYRHPVTTMKREIFSRFMVRCFEIPYSTISMPFIPLPVALS